MQKLGIQKTLSVMSSHITVVCLQETQGSRMCGGCATDVRRMCGGCVADVWRMCGVSTPQVALRLIKEIHNYRRWLPSGL
jgi:hypothetical protein